MGIQLDIDRRLVVDATRNLIGLAWGHQRRGPTHVDCVGVIILVARKLAYCAEDFNFTGYSRRSELWRLVEHFRSLMEEKNKTERTPGDVLVVRDRLYPCHCGIVGDKPSGLTMIHARAAYGRTPTHGAVREEPLAPDWTDRITHCFKFHGLN